MGGPCGWALQAVPLLLGALCLFQCGSCFGGASHLTALFAALRCFLLCSGGRDHLVRVWDVEVSEPLPLVGLQWAPMPLRSLAMDPDHLACPAGLVKTLL